LWETGPDHSFTWLSKEDIGLGITSSRIGAQRWTFATDVVEEPEKWRAHVATLEAREPFRNFVYKAAAHDGAVVYVSTTGRPAFDARDRFLGYRRLPTDGPADGRAEH